MTNPIQENQEHTSFDLRQELDYYLNYWKWFVFGAVVFLLGAFIYLRYATPIYKATATILVKDDKKGGYDCEI